MRVLLAVVLAVGVPAVHHTTTGTKAARATLLKLADMGKGWTAATAAQRGVRLTCAGHAPNGNGIVETGAASSPSYSSTTAGPFVQQNSSVFATSGQANTWWRRAVTPSLVTCVAQTIDAIAAKGVKVSLSSKGPLPVTTSLQHTAAYRVVAIANGNRLYFDVIILAAGRTITDITISSFVNPVPSKYEQALATLVVRKLGGPTA